MDEEEAEDGDDVEEVSVQDEERFSHEPWDWKLQDSKGSKQEDAVEKKNGDDETESDEDKKKKKAHGSVAPAPPVVAGAESIVA